MELFGWSANMHGDSMHTQIGKLKQLREAGIMAHPWP